MNTLGNSKYCDPYYQEIIIWGKKMLINSIKKDIKENFFRERNRIGEKEINDMLKKDRQSNIETIKNELIDRKLIPIIETAHEDTDYHKNAQFLLKYIEKILSNLKDYNKYLMEDKKDERLNRSLRSVFETEEDEKNFYELADDYMYAGFESILEKCKKVPSEFIKKIWEEQELREKKEKREKEELEKQKEEERNQRKKELEENEKKMDVWAKEFAEYVDEDTRPIEDICVWCDEDKTKEKEMRKQGKRYTLIQCEEHEKTKTSIEDQTRYVDLLLEKF